MDEGRRLLLGGPGDPYHVPDQQQHVAPVAQERHEVGALGGGVRARDAVGQRHLKGVSEAVGGAVPLPAGVEDEPRN